MQKTVSNKSGFTSSLVLVASCLILLYFMEGSILGFGMLSEAVIIFFSRMLVVSVLFFIFFNRYFYHLGREDRQSPGFTSYFSRKKSPMIQSLGIALFTSFLLACSGQPMVGVNKDMNTGMVTTYSKLKPEETVLVMNEEKLGHTQIPLGENFVVINNKVKGLVVKDNKVSIGCSLVISDSNGKELMHEEDLFKDNGGIYNEKDAEHLRCTVSTGKPMEYEKSYNVAVRFWDKYGSGSIENKFSIEIIDLP